MSRNESNLFRITIKPDSKDGQAFNFCLNHNIIGIGWKLWDKDGKSYTLRDIKDCEEAGRRCYPTSRGFITAIRCLGRMKPDDLVWTKHNDIYYLCRVTGTWEYHDEPEYIYEDIENTVAVEFYEVGTKDKVPKRVIRSFRVPGTLQNLWNTEAINASRDIYNNLVGNNYFVRLNPYEEVVLDNESDSERVISGQKSVVGKNDLLKGSHLYRITIKTDSKDGKAFDFCQEKSIVGVGWKLLGKDGKSYMPRDIKDCEEAGRRCYPKFRGFVTAIHCLGRMKPDDLIWTRNNGIYYLCRVIGSWEYHNEPEYLNEDLENVIGVEFNEVGTVDEVPGKVVNSFRSGSSIQGIHSEIALNASKIIYNKLKGERYYETKKPSKDDLFEMLLPEDVEEIVSLYLQIKKEYLVYTSTNKLNTQTYEFVAVARDGSYRCFPQVKTGGESLNGNKYKHLATNGNKVYLFAVSQNYNNINGENIIGLDKKELLAFVYSHVNLMPERIRLWINE